MKNSAAAATPVAACETRARLRKTNRSAATAARWLPETTPTIGNNSSTTAFQQQSGNDNDSGLVLCDAAPPALESPACHTMTTSPLDPSAAAAIHQALLISPAQCDDDDDEDERNPDGRSIDPPDDDDDDDNGGAQQASAAAAARTDEVIVIEDDEIMPWGWQKRMSRSSGKPYYLNLFSKKSQWQAPSTPGWVSPTRSDADFPKVRCSHLLVRHRDSRRPMSWRGDKIQRSLDEAVQLAWTYRDLVIGKQVEFDAAAQRFSDCGSARQGGDIGWITRGHMQRAFEEQAFRLQVEEICDAPVITKTGVHIIKRTG